MSRSRPRRYLETLLILVILVGATGGSAVRAEDEPDQATFIDRVNRAIEQGVIWLLAKPALFTAGRHEVAHWGLIRGTRTYSGEKKETASNPAGPTALALYTLLKCGVDPAHPTIEKGFNWLREYHPGTLKWDGRDAQGAAWRLYEIANSYELSAIILALTAKYDQFKKTARSMAALRKGKLKIKDRADRKWLETLVQALVDRRRIPGDQQRRGWRYNRPGFKIGRRSWSEGGEPPRGSEDLSSTQLAALALFSAHRFGIRADTSVWADIANFTLDQQEDGGPKRQRHDPVNPEKAPFDRVRGFGYMRDSEDEDESEATGAMTACGIANLLMAREVLGRDKRMGKSWSNSEAARAIDTAIHDGLAWLDRWWSPYANPKDGYSYNTYYLYSLERAMDLLGKRLVGRHLWYEEGATSLLQLQIRAEVEVPGKQGRRKVPCVYWNTGTTNEPKDVLDTCFALLFLKRATRGMVPPRPAPVTGGR